MRILMLTPYAPYPPNSGGRMRLWEEIRFLGGRHDLTLVSFYQEQAELQASGALNNYCRRAYMVRRPAHPRDSDLESFRSLSDLFRWYTTPEMTRVLYALQTETFDLLLLHHIFMAQYREWFPARAALEEQNIESTLFWQHAEAPDPDKNPAPARGLPRERSFRLARWLLLRDYENATWPLFPLRIVVSENDRQEMSRRCAAGRTVVVENGIHTGEVALLPRADTRQILFMGSLDFYPNLDALAYLRERILPLLWAKDPSVSLVVAGRKPPESVRALAADARIQVVADPPDMRAVAASCALTVAPLRLGSGTRVKILHSMALGRPVVTTRRGCEGLAVEDGRDLLVRDEPEAFAEAVLQTLDDPGLAERLRTAGRRLVETRYDWQPQFAKLESELFNLAHSSGRV